MNLMYNNVLMSQINKNDFQFNAFIFIHGVSDKLILVYYSTASREESIYRRING